MSLIVTVVTKREDVKDFYDVPQERIDNLAQELESAKFISFTEIDVRDKKERKYFFNVSDISQVAIWSS